MQARRTLDPYAILGVSRDATPLQVARAHRRLAKRHHPDLQAADAATAAAEQMRLINEAWAILSNPLRRSEFDHDYPVAGTPAAATSSSHWAPNRAPIRPMPSSATTRTWASWRATAARSRSRARDALHDPIPCRRRSETRDGPPSSPAR
jgi:curved DNA-binding protein CbpA